MAKRHKLTEFDESARLNTMAFDRYYNTLTRLAITTPVWTLPESCDQRYLERSLYYSGIGVIYRDPVLGFLSLKAVPGGGFNEYGYPYRVMAYGYNGFQVEVTQENSVLVYDNVQLIPFEPTIRFFSYQLYDLDCSIRVNARTQKTPVLLEADENERLTMENLYKEYDGNSPVIKTTKWGSGLTGLKVLKTDAPFTGDKLYELKLKYWNEAITEIGIPNMVQTKKERQTTDEVARDMAGTLALQNSRLYMRLEALKKLKAKWPEENWDIKFFNPFEFLGGMIGPDEDEIPEPGVVL